MILCIIQARMGSSRLPGKVLKELCGKTLLEHEIERLKYCRHIDRIVVATTESEADNAIINLCRQKNIDSYRGSEEDVLDRFYQAARSFGIQQTDVVIRITADCPLIDPNVVDDVINLFKNSNADYASNINPPTYPDGLDTEVFSFTTLEKAWHEAKKQSEREHVTLYIRNHPELFSIVNLSNDEDYSGLRWTVDELEDFEVAKAIYQNLYCEDRTFLMKDVIEFISTHSEIQDKNKIFRRDEGLLKSLQNDKLVK